MSNLKLNHHIAFTVDRQENWPESLPWPEWKPATDKSYRPEVMSFVIGWDSTVQKIYQPGTIIVTGPRILQSGTEGSVVKCTYYGRDRLDKELRASIDYAVNLANTYARTIYDVPIPVWEQS